jgi:hypothetical protein
MTTISQLRGICERASGGTWRTPEDCDYLVFSGDHSVADCGPNRDFSFGMRTSCLNAHYISTFSPSLVSKLLDVVERYEGALEFYADPFEIMDHISGSYTIEETHYLKARDALAEGRKMIEGIK